MCGGMQTCNLVVLCRRIGFVLPILNNIEDLRLELHHLDSTILEISGFANLKAISLSCATYMGEIDELLYCPKLENLHIACLKGQDLVSSSCKVALLACLHGGSPKCLSDFCPCMPPHVWTALAPSKSILTVMKHSCQAQRTKPATLVGGPNAVQI